MSASLLNAGRTTHLKIVAVALMAGIAVVGVGINNNIATDRVGADAIVRAGQPLTYAGQESVTAR
jgi:hypothetical protein